MKQGKTNDNTERQNDRQAERTNTHINKYIYTHT